MLGEEDMPAILIEIGLLTNSKEEKKLATPERRLSLVCFFFQAEDGIRDLYVTGVQTCALPIFRCFCWRTPSPAPSSRPPNCRSASSPRLPERRSSCGSCCASAASSICEVLHDRSEERRVGKECRCGWWQEHCKRKYETSVEC